MESLKEDYQLRNKKIDESFQSTIDGQKKMIESIKEDGRKHTEELCQIIDDGYKRLEERIKRLSLIHI